MNKERALDFILNHEGPEYNQASDADQESKWGITPPDLRDERCPADLRDKAIKDLTREDARRIVGAIYWDPCSGDDLPPLVALAVVDCVLLGGDGIRYMQEALDVDADGKIGDKTRKAAAQCDARSVATHICAKRALFYLDLVGRKPIKAQFARGWRNRVNDLLQTIRTEG